MRAKVWWTNVGSANVWRLSILGGPGLHVTAVTLRFSVVLRGTIIDYVIFITLYLGPNCNEVMWQFMNRMLASANTIMHSFVLSSIPLGSKMCSRP